MEPFKEKPVRKSIKVTIDVNADKYGDRINSKFIEITGHLTIREVEDGLNKCIEVLQQKIKNLRETPYRDCDF